MISKSNRIYPKVAVIILVYNSLKWIELCMKSVFNTVYPNYEVFVVDNNSNDGASEYIKANFKGTRIIKNKKNLGFAGGCNVGIREALKDGSDYVVLLNPDTTVHADWIMNMIKSGEENSDIGILGGLQYDYSGEKIDLEYLGARSKNEEIFNDLLNNKKLKSVYFTSGLVGACFCIKKGALRSLGLLDPHYFMYGEETDFCRRAIHKGFKIALCTTSIFYHNRTSLDKNNMSPRMRYLQLRNYFMCTLKDPTNSLLYNFKYVFLWTSWKDVYRNIERGLLMELRVRLFLIMSLPSIYWRRHLEARGPCYL